MNVRFALILVPLTAAAALAALPSRAADAVVDSVEVRSIAHFDFAEDDILDKDRPSLLDGVSKEKNVTWQSITATGHTDSVGSVAINERLSRQRAAAVKAYLVKQGLSPAMIQVAGKGPKEPVAPNDDEQGRAQNRRTEVVFRGIRAAQP